MATLTFDISALDRASSTFDRVADKVDRLAARLRALDSIRANPTVKVDIDDRGLDAVERRLRTLPRRVSAAVSVSLRGAGGVLAQLATLTSAVNALDGRRVVIDVDLRGLGGALAQLATLRALLTAMGTLGGGGGSPGGSGGFVALGRGASVATGAVVTLGAALVKASVAATALAVAGAAVTAAWGAASTAVAVLPSALALLAAPLAAISLGSDAIEKSFKGITDQLKADIGRTWTAELEPIVTRLARSVMPELTTRLRDTVIAMTDVGEHLTGIAEKAAAAGVLKTIFDNVNGAIRGMLPGLEGVVTSLLDIAALPDAFAPITAAVNRFGEAFRRHVTELIDSGTMQAALQGLADTLGLVAEGFAGLVANGIEVFAAAAPGVNQALAQIGGFFDRFDWDRLGTAVGRVFQGIGQAFADVDQSTIDNITLAFERLAQVFNDPGFQQGLQDLIGSIPTLIDWMSELVTAAGGAGTAFAGFVDIVEGAKRVLSSGDIGGFAQIADGLNKIELAAARIRGPIDISVALRDHGAEEQLARIAAQLAQLPAGAKTIQVDFLAPGVIDTLQEIGVLVEAIPGEKGLRLTVPDDEVARRLNEYMSLNPPPIKVPIEPDDSALQGWVPPAVDPLPLPIEPQPPNPPLSSIIPGSFTVPVIPDTTQAIPIINGFRAIAEAPTTSVHTITHNVPQVTAAILTLNQQRTTAPHVQTHNVPAVLSEIRTLNRANTTSTHTVSDNVDSVRSRIMSLDGIETKSKHTINVVQQGPSVREVAGGGVVRAAGGAMVLARRFAGGGILPGYAPGRDTIPALLSPGESVLTPEATRLLGARTIMALNRMTSGRRGVVVGQGAMPGGGRADRPRGWVGGLVAGGSGQVERKLDEQTQKLGELITLLRTRDGVTINVAGSPVGDPAETAQATRLALRTSG